MTTARVFRGFRFPAEVILWAGRWYLQFPVSYRELEAMLADRGVQVDHVSLYRRVQRFAPELEKRARRHLRPCRGPWQVDETFVRVDGQWRYLYRAVDGTGQSSPTNGQCNGTGQRLQEGSCGRRAQAGRRPARDVEDPVTLPLGRGCGTSGVHQAILPS
jgi:hypothetical protein